jgi:MFS transporter, DHA2 family, multidrug resistance protein
VAVGSVQAGVAALEERVPSRSARWIAYADAFRAILVAFLISTALVPFMRKVVPTQSRLRGY